MNRVPFSSNRFWLGMLLLAAGIWSAARYHSFGLFGCDAMVCHLAGLKFLNGQFGVGWIWQAMKTMGRFQAAPQLVGSALLCEADAWSNLDAKEWWAWIAGSALLSMAFFAWGVGRRVGSGRCGALVFLAVISGLNLNLDAHILATWPVFIGGFGALGLGLAFEEIPALSAFFYFLAVCLGNETVLAWLFGLAVAPWLMGDRKGLRVLAAPPSAWGAGAFLVCYFFFNHLYPSGYLYSLPAFRQLSQAGLAWRNLTVSQLPGYDFARLALERRADFFYFIGQVLRTPRMAFLLLGFALFCALAAAVFLRNRERAKNMARRELIAGLVIGTLLSSVPLALTPKYSEMFTSPLHGFYYTYSFFGCAALSAAVVLLLDGWRARAASWLLIGFLVFNAVTSGVSSSVFLIDIRRVASRWALFEHFVDGAGPIIPPGRTVHLVAPDLDPILGAMEPTFLMEYWNAKRSLLAKAGRPGPRPGTRVDFMPALPAHRPAGERYFLLILDERDANLFSSRSLMHCAEAAPDWDGTGPIHTVGPTWTWVDRR